jgi:Periplasmic component of the Tol biopolymer transport system
MKNITTIILSALLCIINLTGCTDNTVSPGGGTTPISDLTRSGKFIAFTSDQSGNNDIWLAQVNSSGILETSNLVFSSNPFNLTSANTSTDQMPNWSPDGRTLVFSRSSGNVQEIYAYFFLATGNIDTSISPNPKKLFVSTGWDNNPSFSPNGSYLIFDRRYDNNSPAGVDTADSRDLYIGSVPGSGGTLSVSNIQAIKTSTGTDEYNPKWSPKNTIRRVAYEYGSSATATDHDIYIIDPLDSNNNVNYYNPGRSGYPAWEPSCTKIIFESDQGNSGFYKIVIGVYPTVGSPVDLVQSSTQQNRYPTWLPNGGLIAYINIPASGKGNIYIVSSTGGTPVKLLPALFDNTNNVFPAW